MPEMSKWIIWRLNKYRHKRPKDQFTKSFRNVFSRAHNNINILNMVYLEKFVWNSALPYTGHHLPDLLQSNNSNLTH